MRYGSIGWSVGATLGYSLAAAADGKRLLSFIGDGSFQMTAQDVSTMLRFGANPIILLINNKGYTVRAELDAWMGLRLCFALHAAVACAWWR